MSAAGAEYRLDGIYKQRQDGFYMQRVKLAAGVISSSQARTVAAVSTRFGQGTIHLTTRGSIEIHWLKEDDLPLVKRELAMTGLTSRGACGGAVRGITCGSQGAQGFPLLETLARRLHRHFTGNPRFERLPKKFKIGVEADAKGGRHLIQDVGLVLAGYEDERAFFDIWIAGGLGKEPRAGFLLSEKVAEERIIPIIEAIIRVYTDHAPPPKRLKFLAKEFGEEKLRRLIQEETAYREDIPAASGLPEHLVPASHELERLELPVFGGKLTAEQLSAIADAADRLATGVLMVTADQDIALLLSPGIESADELNKLRQSTGMAFVKSVATFRICPGSHECQMGLAATRDVTGRLMAHISETGKKLSWALSGCGNSCSQPQLADVGIVASRLTADADGQKTPRFDLYRRQNSGLGLKTQEGLTTEELIETLRYIE
ncbi:MAG: nitrite/sulfite reductase [Desulfuromonadaceae bacterium]|nr:nitrite/sulfite reductase [Desulfuromonadaceae bacterium]